MTTHNITPFDLLSGKVVKNHEGTFWFDGPGSSHVVPRIYDNELVKNGLAYESYDKSITAYRNNGYTTVRSNGASTRNLTLTEIIMGHYINDLQPLYNDQKGENSDNDAQDIANSY